MRAAIASASLACLGSFSAVVHAQATCEHFERTTSELKRQHPHVDISNLSSRELCFDNCTAKQIRADQFWENAAPGAADSIRTKLVEYADWTGYVTDIAIRGRANPIVRIARYVGTASCMRDTYLDRAADGYRLVSNPTLDGFSQEAGYCGGAFVYFETWRGTTYAVLWDQGERYKEIVAYRMTPMLDTEKVCAVRRTGRQEADK
ncbi:hypothetical protein [Paraburkholderia dilworthii]|uniref:hypothetical protein n=1 Tax=Paraburkholderia dilworthii TaxID=948106 RepID=UPI0012681323|nr:hypothetical protein [Paraburkholderia dilworthii]